MISRTRPSVLAARHRWMDLVEVAPTRQAWAAGQQPNPVVAAVAARDRAGTFLNCGDFAGGLVVVDRAIVAAEAALSGPERAFATGTLHLRGMTLAGRLNDRTEAQRHIHAAWSAAEEFPDDRHVHNQIFGPANTATHVLATEGDLGRPRVVIRLSEELLSNDTGLPPTRLGPVHLNTARAHLDVGDRDSAQTSLVRAWDVAPQGAKIHPMSREVLRVLICLHRRSTPSLSTSPNGQGSPYSGVPMRVRCMQLRAQHTLGAFQFCWVVRELGSAGEDLAEHRQV